jgi:hypothetical protein
LLRKCQERQPLVLVLTETNGITGHRFGDGKGHS